MVMPGRHVDRLLDVTPARPGWYAFFEDDEDPDSPIWGEPIEAWGRADVEYTDDPDLDGVEVLAMKVETDVGVLDTHFLEADNFIGLFFSKALSEIADSDLVEYDTIRLVPALCKRLENFISERNETRNEINFGRLSQGGVDIGELADLDLYGDKDEKEDDLN